VLEKDSPKLRQIRVETIRLVNVADEEVVATAKVEANPNRIARILLPVPGRVTSVGVQLGDAVTQGQVILSVESPEAESAESAYLQAEAALTQAQASVAKADTDVARLTDLFAHSAVAKKEVLNAENILIQTKASVEQAKAAREQALRRLAILGLKPGVFGQRIDVKAPLSGKVIEISVVAGEYRNDTNAPLMTIADLATVWAASDVPESYIRFCKIGGNVAIDLVAFPNETFRGRVAHIADTVDPQLRTVKVRAELNNASGRFRPEMSGRVRYSESRSLLPVIASAAVLYGSGTTAVFVEESVGHFRLREVKVARRLDNGVAISSGIRAGDRVVVEGAIYLKGGI
jgi:cobalt-zinc-cadmium efflux system membrane fusion protein